MISHYIFMPKENLDLYFVSNDYLLLIESTKQDSRYLAGDRRHEDTIRCRNANEPQGFVSGITCPAK